MISTPLKRYKGLWIRPEMRADGAMVAESFKNYKHFRMREGDRVLDLGANIGAFGYMVALAGVRPKDYVAYEPDPKNVELLKLNTSDQIVLVQAVATMSRDKSLTFYQTESSNSACSGSATPPERSKAIRKVRYQVDNEYLPDVLEKYRPSHLKVDIEGAEHDWLVQNEFAFPSYVKEIAIELHHHETIDLAEKLAPRIRSEFEFVSVVANAGFIKKSKNFWEYPNLGLKGKGTLFGIDLFLRRK